MRQIWTTQLTLKMFSVRDCFSTVGKYSVTHLHGLTVYVRERVHFARELFLENSGDSHLCSPVA